MFDSHQPLKHKLGVICTLQLCPQTWRPGIKNRSMCNRLWYSVIILSGHLLKHPKPPKCFLINQQWAQIIKSDHHVFIPYVVGVTYKFWKVFSKYCFRVYFKPQNTLRQRWFTSRTRFPNIKEQPGVCDQMQGGVKRSVHCWDKTATQLTHVSTQVRKLLGARLGSQHSSSKRATQFQDQDVYIMDTVDRWFERGVEEAIFVKVKWPSLTNDI